MPDATLRDLRRLAVRPYGSFRLVKINEDVTSVQLYNYRPHRFVRVDLPAKLAPMPLGKCWVEFSIPELDRLIAKLGPKWGGTLEEIAMLARDEGEARNKDTDEVSSAESQSDGALHGGDGNAGEVDSSAETASQEARKEQGDANEDSQCHASGPQAKAAEKDGDEPSPSELGKRDGDAPTGCDRGAGDAIASPPADDAGDRLGSEEALADADALARERDVASASDEALDPTQDADPCEPEGHDEGSQEAATSPEGEVGVKGTTKMVPVYSHGGDTASEWTKIQAMSKEARKDARDVERALRRLIRAVDMGGLDDSPRLDARRFARELVSRRYALTRAARRETTLPVVVLAADVSGSCSACSNETLAAALAVAAELEHVIVVRHSNGWVEDVVGSAARDVKLYAESMLSDVVFSLRRQVACVVAWGDADAAACYRALCERSTRFYWLDSYAAKSGAKPASKHLRETARDWKRQPDGWWQGVNGARRTAIALRAMARA